MEHTGNLIEGLIAMAEKRVEPKQYMCDCGEGMISVKCPCGFEGCVICAPDHSCRTIYANSYGVYER